jgi:hypothetical protein
MNVIYFPEAEIKIKIILFLKGKEWQAWRFKVRGMNDGKRREGKERRRLEKYPRLTIHVMI